MLRLNKVTVGEEEGGGGVGVAHQISKRGGGVWDSGCCRLNKVTVGGGGGMGVVATVGVAHQIK